MKLLLFLLHRCSRYGISFYNHFALSLLFAAAAAAAAAF